MSQKTLTVDQQRKIATHKMMLAVGLHCHLNNLVSDILKGDVSKLGEFQEYVQYAPVEWKDDLLQKIHAKAA